MRHTVDRALLAQDARVPAAGERLLDTTTLTADQTAKITLGLIAGGLSTASV